MQLTGSDDALMRHCIHGVDVGAVRIRRPDAHHVEAQDTVVGAPFHVTDVGGGVQTARLCIPAPDQ